MKRPRVVLGRRVDRSLTLVAIAALLLGLFYVFAYVFLAPYPGVDYNDRWDVLSFDNACNVNPAWCEATRGTLRAGDRLLAIGDLTFQEYNGDRTRVPFAGYQPGDPVPVTFSRDGIVQQTEWQMLGPTGAIRFGRLLAGLILFLPFWLAGTIVLLFLRPRNIRWRLLIAFNYLMAAWLTAGIASATRIAASSPALHALTWLMAPVFLHLHLVVLASLRSQRRRNLLFSFYLVAILLAVLEFLQLLPNTAYYLGLLLALVGSFALLLFRSLGQVPSAERLAARLMLLGASLAFGPGLVLWVIPTLLHFDTGKLITDITTAAIPLLPFFYVYALYKHRLGGLEFRANRVLSLYSFLALFVTAFILVFMVGSRWVELTSGTLAFALIVSALFVVAALFLRTPYQRFIDRLAYGTEHNPEDILRTFVNEIPRALSREALVQLLTREVAPSLLIWQSALYLITDGNASPFYADRVALPEGADVSQPVQQLVAEAGRYHPPETDVQDPFSWVRLAIPIVVRKQLIGVWLLGKRDPDDYYPQPDVGLLSTLGSQIGVALENARLFEDLQRRAAELETAYRDLQQLDRLKDEFVQNVSHELRTPLTSVRGYAELIREGEMGKVNIEQQKALDTIIDRTEGTIRLVNDLISIQQAAVERENLEQVNVVALARSCLDAAQLVVSSQERGRAVSHTFALEAPEDAPSVWGDRRRLSQVLDNLLQNAVKFSPNGGPITVGVRPCLDQFDSTTDGPPPQAAIEISVKDAGIGIPADRLDRIWERFYQIDGSSSRQFGGLGLGLAITRDIVKAHGGAIWVESVVGAGSTFRVVLPAQLSAVAAEASEALDGAASRGADYPVGEGNVA